MAGEGSLRGVLVPLVTPFTASGEVAAGPLVALAHEALNAGAAGIVALGTTAESATLDAAEKHEVIRLCAQACREHSAALIVGAGSGDTVASLTALAALAQWPGVTAALVPVPPYTRPGEAGVLAHFARLAAGSPVPLVLYHVPYRTAQPLGATALHRLARLPNVAGIKYAAGGVDAAAVDLLGNCPPGFAVLAGDDLYFSALLALGAVGGILASAHLATRQFAALAAAWASGDVPAARALGHRLARLSAAAFAEPNPTVIKGALHALGRIPTPDVRLPLLPASPSSIAAALDALTEAEAGAAGR